MEEAADDQYEESGNEEPVEEKAPPSKRAAPSKDLKEKVQCECGRWMSQHTYKYQHKCKARSVAEVREASAAPQEAAAEPVAERLETRARAVGGARGAWRCGTVRD